MQLQKVKMFGEMEKYGNGKKWKNGEWKKMEDRERDNNNYYLLRMIINKKLCFSIQFFPVSIYSISINIVSKENVYHIYQNMENHRQNLKIVSRGYSVSGLQSP